MAKTPWYTSRDLIEAVKRKISVPIAQNFLSDDDILAHANDEMFISQVPSVLSYHEEYYVVYKDYDIVQNQQRYPMPDRAIGMKLRDVYYLDTNGNLFETTRVKAEDKAFFQNTTGFGTGISKYYIENNDIVLLPQTVNANLGKMRVYYFIRPNQLVQNSRAATITSFLSRITVNSATMTAGDKVTIDNIDFTAVSGAPSLNEFQINASSIVTATNLVNAINLNGVVSASNGTPATAQVSLSYSNVSLGATVSVTQTVSGSLVYDSSIQSIQFNQLPTTYTDPVTAEVTDLFTNNCIIDFLQTKPGHKIRGFDSTLITVSGTSADFSMSEVPTDLEVGDYICLQNEAIIPFVPPDLHTALAERTCARILSALGDTTGLQNSMTKIQEIEKSQGELLDNRVEGATIKVTGRNSVLAYNKMGSRRRYFG